MEAVADTLWIWSRDPEHCTDADLKVSLRVLKHLAGSSGAAAQFQQSNEPSGASKT